MFTGLVQDIGAVIANSRSGQSCRLAISTVLPFESFELGCSVACNGACLTVVEKHAVPATQETILEFDVGPKTIELTHLGNLASGKLVNLEKALRVGDELGGHEVTGHIDCLGTVKEFSACENNFWLLRIEVPTQFAKYLVPQGSICVKGVSLTLAKTESPTTGIFEIMIVPHTIENTNFKELNVGDTCEIEFCRTVKTIAHLLENMVPTLLSTLHQR